jgi:hypothetical protein
MAQLAQPRPLVLPSWAPTYNMSESSVVQLAMGDQNHFMPPVQHKTYFVWNFAVKHNYGRLTARDRASAVFRSHLMHDGSDFCFIFF